MRLRKDDQTDLKPKYTPVEHRLGLGVRFIIFGAWGPFDNMWAAPFVASRPFNYLLGWGSACEPLRSLVWGLGSVPLSLGLGVLFDYFIFAEPRLGRGVRFMIFEARGPLDHLWGEPHWPLRVRLIIFGCGMRLIICAELPRWGLGVLCIILGAWGPCDYRGGHR